MKYLLAAAAVFGSIAVACSGENRPANVANNTRVNATTPAASPLPRATINEVASGQKIYEQNCAGCHKDDGSGGLMEIEGKKINADNLASDKIKGFSDEKILGYIMNGIEDEGMPAFKGKLSEGEMRDVVKYVRTEIQKVSTGLAAPKS